MESEGRDIGWTGGNRLSVQRSRGEEVARKFRELEAKMSPGVPGALPSSNRETSRGDADASTARGAGDDAGASGKNPGSESGGGVEAGAARGYVCEHAAEFCEGDGRRVEDYGTVPGGDGGD